MCRQANDCERRSLRLGEVELTLVPDGGTFAIPGDELYGVPASAGWGEHTPPDGDGLVRAMPYSLLVKRAGGVALVDTGGENPAESPGRRSDFLEQLASLGVAREDVATVVITHAHLDHIGYNTVVEDGRWVPTFPNADYVMQEAEVDTARSLGPGSWRRYFRPIEDAGRLRLVTGDEGAAPGVKCLATPGHTMGHQSVVIDCGGGRMAIYVGDLAVTKLHLEHGDWMPAWTRSPAAERESKRKVIDLALGTGALLIFGHDPGLSWGRLARTTAGVAVMPLAGTD